MRAAAACLERLLAGPSPYIHRLTLQPGMGLLCNNVLHDRSGFVDDPAPSAAHLSRPVPRPHPGRPLMTRGGTTASPPWSAPDTGPAAPAFFPKGRAMRAWLAAAVIAWSCVAQAMSPYVEAPKVAAGDVKAAMAEVEKKLAAAGFDVVGRYQPKGLAQYGVVVATDPRPAGRRVRDRRGRHRGGADPRRRPRRRHGLLPEHRVLGARLPSRQLRPRRRGGARRSRRGSPARSAPGKPAGGDVKTEDLAGYRYMIGMERFGDRSDLNEFASFEQAVQTIRDNLAKGVGETAQVYAIVLPDKKVAVFGVALNSAEYGEGWWVNKIGADNIAALPWEIYVVDKRAHALYGRYRTALGWPDLGMGQFMTIVRHPDTTAQALEAVAGKKP